MKDWLKKDTIRNGVHGVSAAVAVLAIATLARFTVFSPTEYMKKDLVANTPDIVRHGDGGDVKVEDATWPLVLDKKDYDKRLLTLAHYQPAKVSASSSTSTKNELKYQEATNVTVSGKRWPSSAAYPNGGAIFPFKRVVAYYGNFYSRNMGILGELDPPVMLDRLHQTVAKWEAADPTTPVVPAIEYIAMVAQADAGADGMYRAVMPDKEIEKAYSLAKEINGILIIDLQVGLSSIQRELPQFKELLSRPETHLALDPEFSMKSGAKPGTEIGTFNADDINFTINWLSDIVREKQLPPKILLIHRFTQNMLTGTARIKPTPEVQVVIVMDGWGPGDLKIGTYKHYIEPEPVQFTGIKLFYKNDLKPPSTGLLTPKQVLQLNPTPIYVQYQ